MMCDICGSPMERIKKEDGDWCYICSKCDYEIEAIDDQPETDQDSFTGES